VRILGQPARSVQEALLGAPSYALDERCQAARDEPADRELVEPFGAPLGRDLRLEGYPTHPR